MGRRSWAIVAAVGYAGVLAGAPLLALGYRWERPSMAAWGAALVVWGFAVTVPWLEPILAAWWQRFVAFVRRHNPPTSGT